MKDGVVAGSWRMLVVSVLAIPTTALATPSSTVFDLLTGPVWCCDEDLQPGGSGFMWSVQFDADIPLRSTH